MAVMKDTGSGPTGLDGAPASITHQLDELYFFDYKMRITTVVRTNTLVNEIKVLETTPDV